MEKKYLFSAVAAGVALSASVYASEIAGNSMFSSLNNVAMVAGNGVAKAAAEPCLTVYKDTVFLPTEENVALAVAEGWATGGATRTDTKMGTVDPATGEIFDEARSFVGIGLKSGNASKTFTTCIKGASKVIVYGVTGSSTDTRTMVVSAETTDGEVVTASGSTAPNTTVIVELELDGNKTYTISYTGIDETTGKGADVTLHGVKFISSGAYEMPGDDVVENKWINIDLATPGSLGVEVLYNVDVLTDVEYLKVTGTLNSTDWSTITQMKNLKALDLRDAKLESIPENGCNALTALTEIYLPEGLKTIGSSAFRYTQLQKITIPASVTSIGQQTFYGVTTLEEAEFAEGSQLTTIPSGMFRGCKKLTACVIPNTVTSLGSSAFYECNALSNCVLPESLTDIATYVFYRTYNLKNIELPQSLKSIGNYAFQESSIESISLPVGLTKLGTYAFYYCESLNLVELPSYVEKYDYTFQYCRAIKKIICHSATPPAIISDPFGNITKANVELVVPSFAVVNYKLDAYWYQFGSIVGGVESDYWKITAPLSLTNNRRMDGKPSIDMYYNGQLTVGGNAPMEVAMLNMFMSDDTPARIVNTCNAMTADELNTTYKVDANKWYFLSPMHDVRLADVVHSVDGASFVFRYYDGEGRATNGPGSSWKNVTDEVLVAGQGYIFQCNKAGVITMPSTAESIGKMLTAGDVTTSLATYASENTANQNWNFVGNPYPCYYDIYYMGFTAPITVWDMSSRTYKAYSLVDDDVILRPMQAFFVQKPDNVDGIVFDAVGRQMESTVNRASYAPARNARTDRKLFNIVISDGDMTDETRVVINNEASAGYEMDRDASKFMSMSDDVPQIYTVDADGNSLAINERPMLDGKIALSVYAAKAGFYTISLGRADGDISLYDAAEGRTVNLNTEDYTFYVDESGVLEGRFVLMPAIDNTSTGIGSADAEGISVIAGKGSLRVTASGNAVVNVYTADGKKVAAATAVAGVAEFDLAAGVYVVNVNGKTVKSVVY